MKTLTILAAVAATLLSATVADARSRAVDPRRAPAHPGGWEQAPADCPLTVSFGSYGPGIDRPARLNIERLLNSERSVRGFTTHRWGREGEVTLCVRTRTLNDAYPLSRRIRTLIPARPRGPITVNTLRSHRR